MSVSFCCAGSLGLPDGEPAALRAGDPRQEAPPAPPGPGPRPGPGPGVGHPAGAGGPGTVQGKLTFRVVFSLGNTCHPLSPTSTLF
jgi:hypothetical protein